MESNNYLLHQIICIVTKTIPKKFIGVIYVKEKHPILLARLCFQTLPEFGQCVLLYYMLVWLIHIAEYQSSQQFPHCTYGKVFIRIMIHSKMYSSALVVRKCEILCLKIHPKNELNLQLFQSAL